MPIISIEEAETITAPKPRTIAKHKHICRVNINKDGEEVITPLCDSLDIIGTGTDPNGAYYRLIQYTDKITHQTKIAALLNAEIGSNHGWQRLQNLGLTVYAGRLKREWLADYLQEQGSRESWQITDKAGWHGNACILPSGEILRTSESKRIFYNGDKSQADAYVISGSLKDWQNNVAKYAAGNSRLCLALGVAFAAPLLSPLRVESGGFHICGDSSIGKTTAVNLSLSVWGIPETQLLTWKGTGLAFQNVAASRNDGFVVLDEIGQANRKVVADTAYSLFNGINKAQAHKDGGNRKLTRWKVLALSTGEKTPESYLRHTEEWNAGQNVRLPSISADVGQGHGIYETLHSFTNGAELSEYLNDATAQYNGIAGREFIKQIDENRLKAAKEYMSAFMALLPENTSGQARRVAKRFAVAAAALEIAAPITGLDTGVGMEGVKKCFDDWIAANGTGQYEEERIIEATIAFMQRHGGGVRFSKKTAFPDELSKEHAGFFEIHGDKRVLFVILDVIIKEAWSNFDPNKAANVLAGLNWLIRNKNRLKWQLAGKGWYYKFSHIMPPEKAE